jgi:hypothetical protein
MRKLLAVGMAGVLGVLVAACGDGGKAAAEEGLSSAQSALDAVQAEGRQYAPDLVQDIENSLKAARGTYEGGNFRQALAEVQLLPKKMSALDAAVSAKRGALSKEWNDLSGTLPEIVDSIQARVDVLSKTRRLPSGVTIDTVNKAKADADAMARNWSDATDAVTKANMAEAVEKGRTVKAQAAAIMQALGMELPSALK